MQTWTDVTFKLSEHDHLMVCEHRDCVSLGLPGYVNSMEHGRGIYLYLKPAHLAELRQAVEALESMIKVGVYDATVTGMVDDQIDF
jgi:hypothetical protein